MGIFFPSLFLWGNSSNNFWAAVGELFLAGMGMSLTCPEHGEECRDQGRPTRPRKVIGVPWTVGCEATELADGCQSMAWWGSALEDGKVKG